jgi:hypothetical protein
MDKVARLPAEDRAALFGLQQQDASTLVFKGGTSLSKAFGAIRRFSEDIDISFDRADLGYTGERDPEKEGISRKKADKLIEELVKDAERHIAEKLLPALHAAIVQQLGETVEGAWSLELDAKDAQTVNFHYPTALPTTEYDGMAYITSRVKLEFGARGDPWPVEKKVIRPYAAEDYPSFFENPDSVATFWHKSQSTR